MVPAGVENAIGTISATIFKDPADPDTSSDADVKTYLAFMEKYYPAGDKYDTLNVAAFVEGEIMTELMRRCGQDLTRENLLAQLQKFGAMEVPMVRRGLKVRADVENYNLFRSLQLVKFDGQRNRPIGTPVGN